MNARSTVGGPLKALVLSFAALMCPAATLAHESTDPEPVALSSKAVQLDPEDPTRQEIGRLRWRGGIEIASPKARFGGLSGLLVSADGTRLLAVTDAGRWLSANLSYDSEGRLTGIAEGQMARLRDLDGKGLDRKRWRDAESLAQLADGSILVSFEHNHRIWRYDSQDGPLAGLPTAWPNPEGLDLAPENGGVEGLAALADGRLLALTEKQEHGIGTAGYLWHGDAWSPVTYRPHTAFSPTAASRLPGSPDLLVLERAYRPLSGPRVRLVRLAADDIRPGATLEGEELARW
ncbi:MAG: esterase-like activity of phytase family protein, partial [Kiloniellales bacterium]|nr:esterase-like activity of phytase family protein [Kiloniellales bacterium]